MIPRLVLLSPLLFGAWWGFDHLRGRFMDIDEAIAAYYDGDRPTAFRAFERLAEEGNPRAQLGLAAIYKEGGGPEEDRWLASYIYRDAAMQGNSTAAYFAGVNGWNLEDWQRLSWLQESADRFHPLATAEFGRAYLEGRLGVEPDLARGREILTRAASDGNGLAAYYLGFWYQTGQLTEGPEVALDMFLTAVHAGHREAADWLLRLLSERNSPIWNPEEAYRWGLVAAAWRPAPRRGDPERWLPPIEFMILDDSAIVGDQASRPAADAPLIGRHSLALAAIDNRIRAFASRRYEELGPLPDLKGLFVGLDNDAILRAEMKAMMFLNSHPTPAIERRLFD